MSDVMGETDGLGLVLYSGERVGYEDQEEWRMSGVKVFAHYLLPDWCICLRKNGQVVGCYSFSTPLEDAEFDEIGISPANFEKLKTIDLNATDSFAAFMRQVLGPYNPVKKLDK